MSASPIALPNPSSRSLEWLVGPDALLSSTALSTSQLSSLGPIASLIEGTVDTGSSESSASQLPDEINPIANQIILDTHAQLEDVGHQVAPLNGPLHGLTNLGETIGLGHLGQGGHLLTDLGSVAANPTDTGAIAPLLSDTGHITDAAGSLLDTVTALPEAGNGLVGTGSVLTPGTEIVNQAILDFHTTLEDVGHEIPVLNTPIHALTGLGETAGLGHIGETGNLVTDLSTLPGSILNGGGLASAAPVLTDLGHVLGSVDTLAGSFTGAANAGGLLSSDGLLGPVTNLANSGVLDLHATLENVGHEVPLLNDTIHGLTNLGETIGLGHLGEGGNLLTSAAALPGELLGGHGLGAVAPILGEVGAVTNAGGGLVDGITGILGEVGGGSAGTPVAGVLAPITPLVEGVLGGHASGPIDGLLGGVTGGNAGPIGALLGSGAPLQPAADLGNGVIDGIHANLEQVGHELPVLNDPIHSVIQFGNTAGLGELGHAGNVLTDGANLPGSIFGGTASSAAGQVAGDLGHTAEAAGGVVSSVASIPEGIGTGALGTGTLVGGLLTPAAAVLEGSGAGAVAGPVGTLLNGVTGGGTATEGGGTHPLITVSAGPVTTTPVAEASVLTPAADPAHTVQASAIAVPAEQPSLVNANLLTGESIAFPQTSGGADPLVGHPSATAATPSASSSVDGSHGLTIDLGPATIDLGGHTEAQHTDPTPHTTLAGTHLLGL